MRRPRPNLHPQAARLFGIRLMYAPPYRHVPHVPARPLVIRSSLRFPGAMRYCADMRRNLRRRIIMDVVQLLFGVVILALISAIMIEILADPRWYLVSIIPQAFIAVGLANADFCHPLYAKFANWWMRSKKQEKGGSYGSKD